MQKDYKKNLRRYLVVVVLLIFLHYTKILSPVEKIVFNVLNPIFSTMYTFGTDIRMKVSDMSIKKELIKTETELTVEIRELTKENVKLKIIEAENKKLRNFLNFFTVSKYKYKMSNVISRENNFLDGDVTEVLIIDKGLEDGVLEGYVVVNNQGIIIGKVLSAKNNFSKVYLVNSNKCKLAAKILNGENTSGLTEGELGLTIRMNYIPQDKEIKVGDIIISSGLEKFIPDGLIIGKVISVRKESNELWQSAIIEPLINPGDLTIVSVLLP